ncbi:MAG: hypothetical protein ACI8UO_002796 [Verrucomicrobiales bacterium]|jgi:hypothetical protein
MIKRLSILLLVASSFMLQSCFEPTTSPYGTSYGSGASKKKDHSASETIRKVRQMSGSSLRRGY